MSAEPTDAATGTRLRADARRNREQIITAARRIFVERGAEAPMEDIARAAGVGVGTLYRRFPDRDSLIRAVAIDNFQDVLDNARVAAQEESDAWRAMTRFLHTTTALQVVIQLSMLSPRARRILAEDAQTQRIRDELIVILDDLVAAAQREGRLRTDVGSGDLALFLSLIVRDTGAMSGDMRENATNRYLTLILDGLQARPGTPLPGRPITSADLDEIRKSSGH
jgi:AcrR family transcriptional regulator